MRCSFRWLVKIASCVLVLCATVHRPALAQESESGRRPSRTSRPPTFLVPPGLEQDQPAEGFRGRSRREVSSENNLSDEPTESVALRLWILTVSDTPKAPEDELSGRLVERVGNLPPVVGSVNDVRELVGQLKVAGLLRTAREFRVVTLNGQSITAQRGRNQPRVVATSVDPRAGRMNQIAMEPLGTQVELRPWIDAERNIQVSVKIGASDVEKSSNVVIAEPANGSPTFADVVTTWQFNTATSLKNNTAVLLQSIAVSASDDDAETETELIILGAAVVPVSE
jgi:hypothetical protein